MSLGLKGDLHMRPLEAIRVPRVARGLKGNLQVADVPCEMLPVLLRD
jgi:hypothetical protein